MGDNFVKIYYIFCGKLSKRNRKYYRKKFLTTVLSICIISNAVNNAVAAMAQLVERILGKDEVTGSTPVSSSKKKKPLSRLFLFGSFRFSVFVLLFSRLAHRRLFQDTSEIEI